MAIVPHVFVSAVSSDLRSARRVVNEALNQIGCLPVEQSISGTEYGRIRELLSRWIDPCHAAIHLVGRDYGGEPDPEALPGGQPRRSWTQLEYDYAIERNKKLYVFVCDAAFPFDSPAAAEPPEKADLQVRHRQAVLAGEYLYYAGVKDHDELRQRVVELKLPMEQLCEELRRRQLRHRWMGGSIAAALVLLLGGAIFGFSRLATSVEDTGRQVTEVGGNVTEVKGTVEQLPDKIDATARETIRQLTNPDALAASIRRQISAAADEKIAAIADGPGRWEQIAEIERQRDVQLARVDDLIRLIQEGLQEGATEVFTRAVEILNDPKQGGVDAAIAYLESRRPTTLEIARRHAQRAKDKAAEAQAEREQRNRSLQALLLEAELRETKLDWPAALDLRQQVVELAADWFEARNSSAKLLYTLARYGDAEPHLRAALDLAAGPEQETVALNNLALLLQTTNRLSEAEPLMRRALAIDQRAFGAEHPNLAIHLNNLAVLLKTTNRLSEAEPLMRRALAIDEESFGTEHPRVAAHLDNLAVLLNNTHRLSEAEPLMRRALAIDEQSIGTEYPQVARHLNNLAQLLKATNRLSEAAPLMRRALAVDEQSFGTRHPNVAIRLSNLAMLLHDTNRLSEADPLSRRALAILARFNTATGHEHPHYRAAQGNYVGILRALEISPAEIEQRLQAVAVEDGPLPSILPEVERLLGPATPVAEVLAQLDDQYRREGRPEVYFLPLNEPIAPRLDELLGPAPATAEVLQSLDNQYRQAGRPAVWFLPPDQPIAPHLDQLLGPTKSVAEVLADLDASYREQNKPAVYFLPLDQPISPHLDSLLGLLPEAKE